MRVEFKDTKEIWPGRGRPRKEIPQDVQHYADDTMRLGKACVIALDPDEEEEAAELVKLLRLYAKRQGKRMRIKFGEGELSFQMLSKRSRVIYQ